jgi:hypothetical protein
VHVGLPLVIGLVSTALANPGSRVDPPPPDQLTEFNAASWGASADGGTSLVFDDTARVLSGGASLRYETDGCFDTRMWAPATQDAGWDFLAGGAGGLSFWVYAENDDGFQGPSPWIQLHTDANNYLQFRPEWDILNDALNNWILVSVPFNGNDFWTRVEVGTPNLADIDWIEIHSDTWGCTFTLWFDDLRFDLPFAPPQQLVAVAGDGQVALKWRPYIDPTGTFLAYNVYRELDAFTSTDGLVPVATITDIDTTTYTDGAVANGIGYHYAVTAVLGPSETTEVQSVGPRVPHYELDVQVTHISRTPRYPRYCPEYQWYELTEPGGFGPYGFSAATGLGCGQTPDTQRWPAMNDPVTYTAHVRNRGTAALNAYVQPTWFVDNVQVASESVPLGLLPGQTATFEYVMPWDGDWHEIRFELNAPDARPENDRRTIWTKSAPFLTYCDIGAIEDFRDRTTPLWPGAATDDLIDWLQRHIDEMNGMFIAAGSTKRAHYDHLAAIDDYDADPTSPESISFGIFPFRYYGASIGDPRSPGYYHADVDIDYGLCHELSHQLGLIDLYQLDLPGEWNQVSGLPYSAVACLMHGVSPLYSEHSGDAMTHWSEVVHGYYGQYLYRIPQTIRLRILANNGQPLPDATVTMYQMVERPGVGKVITNQAKAQGVTDASGIWVLPNVPISQTGVVPTSLIGDTLPDNPFGWVAVVGTNGVLHFKVEALGEVDYCWLDITEVNVAYWNGDTQVATFDRQLALGAPDQVRPPPELTELNAANWSLWVEGGSGSVFDVTQNPVVGAGMIRMTTDGGFDNRLRYPTGLIARWDLSTVDRIKFWVRAQNTNIGFQNGSPWIILNSVGGGKIELRPTWEALNDAINNWLFIDVPLTGNASWTRTETGSPNISQIKSIDIHADTWGSGFALTIDGLRFAPYPGAVGDINCDGQVDFFDIDSFVVALGGEAPYLAAYPDCWWRSADADCDGDVDFFDIDPFVACLGTECSCRGAQ